MKKYSKIGIVATIALVTPLCATHDVTASVVVFNSQQGYDLVTPQFGISNATFELTEFDGLYDSISGGEGADRWSVESASGINGVLGEWITAANPMEQLFVQFQSDEVFGVGGTFYVIDDLGQSVGGIMRLTLSDGTTFFNDLSPEGMFAGFVSTELSIKSLSIYAFSGGSIQAAAISDLTVGVIPAPASLILLSVGLGLRRRRS